MSSYRYFWFGFEIKIGFIQLLIFVFKQLAEDLGPYICMLKTHADILTDFDSSKMQTLNEIAKKHNFLVFEDRKFADIGHTVQLQYTQGVHRISEWSHIINAHTVAGPGTVQGLEAASEANQGVFLLIAEMSSSVNLITPEYTER